MKLFKMIHIAFMLFALSLSASSAAEELLIVDLSTPNKVTITATPGVSSATVSGGDFLGLYMANFFAEGQNTTSGLGASVDSTPTLNSTDPIDSLPGTQPLFFRANTFTENPDPGLNLYNWSNKATVSFTTGEQAFTGMTTWSVSGSAYDAMLVGGERGGDIYFPAASQGDVATASLIGQYSVVIPEPSSLALLGLGGLLIARRRR